VSRRAGRIAFGRYAWELTNIGRRSFYLVDAGTEVELQPAGQGRESLPVLHDDAWIRVPCEGADIAVVLEIPTTERPDLRADLAGSESATTDLESPMTLTDNELLSVLAIYENYLQLPPAYRREPNSFRAAAHRLRVEEGKVKADLRRAQEKVARAGGPGGGGSRYRDALIEWLMSRGVVRRRDRERLDLSDNSGDRSRG